MILFNWASLVAQTVKNSPTMREDPGSITGLGRCPGGGHSNSLQYPRLKNPHGQRSLVGYPWGRKESDTTEQLSTYMQTFSVQRLTHSKSPNVNSDHYHFLFIT